MKMLAFQIQFEQITKINKLKKSQTNKSIMKRIVIDLCSDSDEEEQVYSPNTRSYRPTSPTYSPTSPGYFSEKDSADEDSVDEDFAAELELVLDAEYDEVVRKEEEEKKKKKKKERRKKRMEVDPTLCVFSTRARKRPNYLGFMPK